MGIEPTKPLLAQSFIGFEDRGRHQSDARFRPRYHTAFCDRQGDRAGRRWQRGANPYAASRATSHEGARCPRSAIDVEAVVVHGDTLLAALGSVEVVVLSEDLVGDLMRCGC